MSRIVPTIPLQPLVTVNGSYQGAALIIPEEVMAALDAWAAIKDEEEANRVAIVLQERINQLCHPMPS
jgi:hypothetical protein